jgi:hypothetical protein
MLNDHPRPLLGAKYFMVSALYSFISTGCIKLYKCLVGIVLIKLYLNR